MRAMLALFATFAVTGAAEAADWEVARSDAACEAGVTLTARGAAPAPMTVRSDGDQVVLRLSAPAAAELVRLEIDGKPAALDARRVGDAVEAPLTEAVSEALAKGM